ncbi:circularly permuted type 2 ATP-grasp protein [Rhodococcus sp. NPDC019627]|uniref:circularly permuted type 2 ATP-grasp protein n=1 Tax=unclassified Rhodococcus (in: high G+C Gram-positive bacteria) TaxID=192944 RepID=UPI0034083B5F
MTAAPHRGPEYDELFDADGKVRAPWSELGDGLLGADSGSVRRLQSRIRLLVDNHGITYNPLDGSDLATGPSRWEIDAIPLLVAADEWEHLEAGLLQRSRLLDAVLADLYGPMTLLRSGAVPARLVFGHPGYLRPAHGMSIPGRHQLFFHALDVGRGTDGNFHAVRDHTQSPGGAGYAMANRRVIARAVPGIYETVGPRPLSSFAQSMRLAAIDAAPVGSEDPLVVVLSPHTRSGAAFDQAYLATVLGFPLVESADLVVRDGRIWMRSLGRLEQVDVIIRRVDAELADPLDLRPGSRSGVVGLVEVLRRGAVTVVNTLGSGVLENPALTRLLPVLSRRLLDEDLLLPSVPTFWGGDRSELTHILANVSSMVLRAVRGGPPVVPSALDDARRTEFLEQVRADPSNWVGQIIPDSSYAPSAGAGGEVNLSPVGVRLFSVAQRVGFVPMSGGLGTTLIPGAAGGDRRYAGAKDVWVRFAPRLGPADTGEGAARDVESLPTYAATSSDLLASPRALSELFSIGRCAERAEGSARLMIAVGEKYRDYRLRPWLPGAGCLPILLDAVLTVAEQGNAPGEGGEPAGSANVPDGTAGPVHTADLQQVRAELRSLTVDPDRDGSLARAVRDVEQAARAVRGQLSNDIWAVLSTVERALGEVSDESIDDGSRLFEAQSAVLGGMLALSGVSAESLVRDTGWHIMDIGKRIERASTLTTLVASTMGRKRDPATERALIESLLIATESSVVYRRRNRSIRPAAVAELLLFDIGNPRSLVFQLEALRTDLAALPDASGSSPAERLAEDMLNTVRRVDPARLERIDDTGVRTEVGELTTEIDGLLGRLSEVMSKGPLSLPGGMQPLWGSTASWTVGGEVPA